MMLKLKEQNLNRANDTRQSLIRQIINKLVFDYRLCWERYRYYQYEYSILQ
jgi:hypothetical protein